MKTLEQYLKDLKEGSFGLSNYSIMDLNKYGLTAFAALSPEIQVEICQAYSWIFRPVGK